MKLEELTQEKLDELLKSLNDEKKGRLKLQSFALNVYHSSSELHISKRAYDVVLATDELIHGKTLGFELIDSETAK